MVKIIELSHHLDDYECMWNGIEDIYISQTKQTLPPSFFFSLSSFGSFCYMKTNKAKIKRLVAIGDGRTKNMYEFLAPVVGFEYKHYVHTSFDKALSRAKKEIDNGYPVVLGALDMFYLPHYEKLYHKQHIPFHYELMVGYDDEKELIYIHDCGRKELQTLSYQNINDALNCSYEGLSKPYTVCTVRMGSTKDKYQIAKEAIMKRKEQFLNPPVRFIGYKGFDKFIKELPLWKNEMSKEDCNNLLTDIVMFMGIVPQLPNALSGINKKDEHKYGSGFDKMSVVLKMLGQEYKDTKMIKASDILNKGADISNEIKETIVNYLTDKKDETDKLPELFKKLLDAQIRGYDILDYTI